MKKFVLIVALFLTSCGTAGLAENSQPVDSVGLLNKTVYCDIDIACFYFVNNFESLSCLPMPEKMVSKECGR